jgi:hypothetical protein
MVIKASE